MQHRLATILVADVVGYSALIGEDETGTLLALKSIEETVIGPAISKADGRIFKRLGDGYLVEFKSVVAATECALEWQSKATGKVQFRMAIHLGDVIVDGEDLLGDSVNIAARLEPLARTGGICFSEDAEHQLRGKLDAEFEFMGALSLKNIAKPVRAYRLIPSGDVSHRAVYHDRKVWGRPRVFLSPFRNLSGQNDEVAQTVTESVAEALSCFDAFSLIDPAVASPMIGDGGIAQAFKDLNANYVLEGSVQSTGGGVRVRVQLCDNEGARVWSDNFDHASDDLIAIEREIAATVASTMGEGVEAELARAIVGMSDDALTPHQMLVRGAEYMHRINPADNLLARGFFERALDLAPKQSRLHGALAATYVLELVNGWPPSRKDMQAHCRQYLSESLRADDRSPLLHRLMSRFYAFAGDGDKALAHSERAIDLNPYDSDIIYNHALSVAYTGDVAKAAIVLERAISTNPYAPPYYRSYLSLFYFLTGRAGDGLAVLGSIDETVGPTWVVRIANLVGLNRTDEAHEEAKNLMAARPEFTIALAVQGLRTIGTAGQKMLGDALSTADLPWGEG